MKLKTDTRSRKWQITINNPLEHGFSQQNIEYILNSNFKLDYWVMSDEIGECGTYHTHFYIYSQNAIRFSTIKKHFPVAHIEMAKGTSQQNRDYVFKEGKHKNKEDTNLKNTHREFGEMPIERQGARNDLADLYAMIKEGLTNYEILEQSPSYMLNIDKIERVRQILKEEEFKNTFRKIHTTYICGPTGAGKTRCVMEEYGYTNVYRVTDYKNPFDGYKGEDVIIFEEFRSSLKIQDMLVYLEGYPLQLPCRYANKIACYTKVYIISNWKLEEQYMNIQNEHFLTWQAFLRRINEVICFNIKKKDEKKEVGIESIKKEINIEIPTKEEIKKEVQMEINEVTTSSFWEGL